jgi:hypothetical protein
VDLVPVRMGWLYERRMSVRIQQGKAFTYIHEIRENLFTYIAEILGFPFPSIPKFKTDFFKTPHPGQET